MIKIERSVVPPPSLQGEKTKANGKYNRKDVIDQLSRDFHGKCYLCEKNDLDSIEVEHLHPHKGVDLNLKFDWNNLFYCCSHCNSVKNQRRYDENVIDCCTVDPEELIKQEVVDGIVSVTCIAATPEAENTAQLIYECFELDNHPIRSIEADTKKRALLKIMTILYKTLENYDSSRSEDSLNLLKTLLNRTSPFAGFTRTYVRDRISQYPELQSVLAL